MKPPKMVLAGEGMALDESPSHPSGFVYSGGYDAEVNCLYLSSVLGHPEGIAAAGGDPSKRSVSGIRVFLSGSGDIYWTNDSMSIPRMLDDMERSAIQLGLERLYVGRKVVEVDRLQDIPRYQPDERV